MYFDPARYATMPLGIVVRRAPGVTRWAKWSWRAVAVLPGAGPADWKVLREEDGVTEYHAATVCLELHGAEAEAYMHGLSAGEPGIYVIMRRAVEGEIPLKVALATASPYEAQDYMDNGEDLVDKVPIPPGLEAWVRAFTAEHFEEEPFRKRQRVDRAHAVEDGKGDPRIRQMADVYRAPSRAMKEPQV